MEEEEWWVPGAEPVVVVPESEEGRCEVDILGLGSDGVSGWVIDFCARMSSGSCRKKVVD